MAANVQIIISYRQSGSTKESEDGLDRLKKKAGDAGQGMSSFGQMAVGALRRVGEMAVNALAAAGQAVVSFVGNAIKGAGDYEQSMNVFQATTQATDAQMQQVQDTAKALGADLTLPATSAASAGAAMTALAQAGLSVDDAMSAAKGTLQLAAAGMIDDAQAAEITAAALNQFHLQGSEAVRVADLLAASISASGSGVAQTGQAVQQAGASFAAAHVPIEDFVTLVNEMAKAGIKGSDAGTSLKTMLMRLQAPTSTAAQAMDELGINVYDAQGQMLPMRAIIGNVSTALSGLTQKERDRAVVTIFGADAQRAANIVLAGGTEAYDKMRAAVVRQGAAQEMAAAQMQGLNGAVAGLGSQLETLALEGMEPLLPIMTGVVSRAAEIAGSFVGQVGPAVREVIGFFAAAGHVVQDAFVPALAAAGAATAAYAITNLPMLGIALALVVQRVIIATGALMANAAAAAAAAAPYLLIAAAVYGVIKAYQGLQDQLASVTDKVLAASPAWQESVNALAAYDAASKEAKAATQDQAEALRTLQTEQRAAIEQYALHTAAYEQFGMASGQTVESLDAERLAINARGDAIIQGTASLNAMMQTQTQATAQTQAQTQALAANQGQIQLTEEELDKLGKQLEKVYQDGTTAVGSYVNAAIGFNAQLTGAVAAGNQQQAHEVALNYAQQAAAARASIGQQLTDYTIAWGRMNGVSEESISAIVHQIEEQFGVAGDISAETFLNMEASIRRAAQGGSTAIAGLGMALGNTTDKAVAMKGKMDALEGEYTATLVDNFAAAGGDVDELRHRLDRVPRRVDVEVHTSYTESGHPLRHGGQQGDDGYSGRAGGGPVASGTPYLIGERGPEVFMPQQSGTVVPTDRVQVGGTQVTNVYLNYSGIHQSQGDVTTALRTWQMLYG